MNWDVPLNHFKRCCRYLGFYISVSFSPDKLDIGSFYNNRDNVLFVKCVFHSACEKILHVDIFIAWRLNVQRPLHSLCPLEIFFGLQYQPILSTLTTIPP